MAQLIDVLYRLSDADVKAIAEVLELALENSCSCGESNGKGYLEHDSEHCHVHHHREALKRVAKIIDKAI